MTYGVGKMGHVSAIIEVRVHGLPKPWQRPRFKRRGKFLQPFEAADVTDWKRTVQHQILMQREGFEALIPLDRPLRMEVEFILLRPKSLPKRETHPTKKPDLDNLFKGIADCLNGIVYRDDALLVEVSMRKVYGDQPGARILLYNPQGCP